MTTSTPPGHLSEVLRLCTALAYRALDARIVGLSMPAEQAVALVKVSRLLQDHGVEWPPLLAQVLQELDRQATKPGPISRAEPLEGVDLQGLSLFLAGYRQKDQT